SKEGMGWYRCCVKVPASWATNDITLAIENVDGAHEAYFNGARVGAAGRFPPNFQNGVEVASRYVLPRESVKSGEANLVAIRVYDPGGRRAGDSPQVGTAQQHISLKGTWQFRAGDDLSWAQPPADLPLPLSQAAFNRIEEGSVPRGAAGHRMSPRG